jgi:hypothetical protein
MDTTTVLEQNRTAKDGTDEPIDGKQFRVAVTGDTGTDVYTQYKPGCLSSQGDDQFYPEIAYDVEVPSGADLLYHGLRTLLPADRFLVMPAISLLKKLLDGGGRFRADRG